MQQELAYIYTLDDAETQKWKAVEEPHMVFRDDIYFHVGPGNDHMPIYVLSATREVLYVEQ